MPGFDVELGIPTTVASTIVVDFDYTSSSPVDLLSVHENQKVVAVVVHIATVFNDGSTTLSVGHTGVPNAVFPSTDLIPTEAGSYRGYPNLEYFGADTIRLYLSVGTSSQGAGSVAITVYNKE
jgi:hypothetical protein